MTNYELSFTLRSPGSHVSFMEFSPNGRFLAVGDRQSSFLFILDEQAGFRPTISITVPAKPTALMWETDEKFYVGLGNGCFFHYQIDLKGNKLVEISANHFFGGYGESPIRAMALDSECKTMVLLVGPEVNAM